MYCNLKVFMSQTAWIEIISLIAHFCSGDGGVNQFLNTEADLTIFFYLRPPSMTGLDFWTIMSSMPSRHQLSKWIGGVNPHS